MTDAWRVLGDELDRWARRGHIATVWWRDDDAIGLTPALERLLGIGAPLALAVVPAKASPELAPRIAATGSVTVIQHGWSHENHAPPGEKSTELHAARGLEPLCAELASGRARLEALFGRRFHATLVPPWNRMAPSLGPRLASLEFEALSMFGRGRLRRNGQGPTAPVTRLDAHVDIIDWRGSRGFRGADAVLADAVAHLAARRCGSVDATEATGLLSHHLVHDEPCWEFVGEFAARCRAHPAVRWLSVSQAVSAVRAGSASLDGRLLDGRLNGTESCGQPQSSRSS